MQTSAVAQSASQPKRVILKTYDRHIVTSPGVRDGKPRVIGRRITVSDIAFLHLQQQISVEKIAEEFDLSFAQIYAALTYYFDHRADIDQREADDNAKVEALKFLHPSKLQEKLKTRGGTDSLSS